MSLYDLKTKKLLFEDADEISHEEVDGVVYFTVAYDDFVCLYRDGIELVMRFRNINVD